MICFSSSTLNAALDRNDGKQMREINVTPPCRKLNYSERKKIHQRVRSGGSAQERETTDFIQKTIEEVNPVCKKWWKGSRVDSQLALGTDSCNTTADHQGPSNSEVRSRSGKLKNTLE